jgi:hypothetical protein
MATTLPEGSKRVESYKGYWLVQLPDGTFARLRHGPAPEYDLSHATIEEVKTDIDSLQ